MTSFVIKIHNFPKIKKEPTVNVFACVSVWLFCVYQ